MEILNSGWQSILVLAVLLMAGTYLVKLLTYIGYCRVKKIPLNDKIPQNLLIYTLVSFLVYPILLWLLREMETLSVLVFGQIIISFFEVSWFSRKTHIYTLWDLTKLSLISNIFSLALILSLSLA